MINFIFQWNLRGKSKMMAISICIISDLCNKNVIYNFMHYVIFGYIDDDKIITIVIYIWPCQ